MSLGRDNTRMKDFHDIWILSRTFTFTDDRLARAIKPTFAKIPAELASGRRGMALTRAMALGRNSPETVTELTSRGLWGLKKAPAEAGAPLIVSRCLRDRGKTSRSQGFLPGLRLCGRARAACRPN